MNRLHENSLFKKLQNEKKKKNPQNLQQFNHKWEALEGKAGAHEGCSQQLSLAPLKSQDDEKIQV